MDLVVSDENHVSERAVVMSEVKTELLGYT
jgi:hypothetical protein